MSAWKPLQMPAMRPSRSSRSAFTASFTASPRKKAVMNLPEPSGSSPAEKPPGRKIIWLSPMRREKSSTDLAMSEAVRFCTTKIFALAPASSMARAVSYSQLVPGKTGMSTWGLGQRTWGARRSVAGAEKVSGMSRLSWAWVG